jgi:hypothetical protein
MLRRDKYKSELRKEERKELRNKLRRKENVIIKFRKLAVLSSPTNWSSLDYTDRYSYWLHFRD